MSYYVYILTIAVERGMVETHMPAHRDYLRQLDTAGALVLSGPFTDRRGGMLLLRAESEDAARAIAEADPLVKHGVHTYELRHWRITGGDLQRLQLEVV
jgi:uncharacterized protein YciI